MVGNNSERIILEEIDRNRIEIELGKYIEEWREVFNLYWIEIFLDSSVNIYWYMRIYEGRVIF